MNPEALRARLLAWYDVQARDLAWRVGPTDGRAGLRQDPYRVWLSEVMLQQTTVPHATPYFLKFTARWPTVTALAAEDDGEVMAAWAGLGYYARARNLLACARAVANDHKGVFPDTEDGLRSLPGLGPYTAAAVGATGFRGPRRLWAACGAFPVYSAVDACRPDRRSRPARRPAGLVRRPWAQPGLARAAGVAAARPLSRLVVRGDAAADHRAARHALFPHLHRPLAHRHRLGE